MYAVYSESAYRLWSWTSSIFNSIVNIGMANRFCEGLGWAPWRYQQSRKNWEQVSCNCPWFYSNIFPQMKYIHSLWLVLDDFCDYTGRPYRWFKFTNTYLNSFNSLAKRPKPLGVYYLFLSCLSQLLISSDSSIADRPVDVLVLTVTTTIMGYNLWAPDWSIVSMQCAIWI